MSLGISMSRAEDLSKHLPARRDLRMFRSKGFLADLKRTTNEPLGFPIVALDGLKHGDRSHRNRHDWMLMPQDPVCQREDWLNRRSASAYCLWEAFRIPIFFRTMATSG